MSLSDWLTFLYLGIGSCFPANIKQQHTDDEGMQESQVEETKNIAWETKEQADKTGMQIKEQ